jgi:hypothetical protein
MDISFQRVKNSVKWRYTKVCSFIRVSPFLVKKYPENFENLSRDYVYDFFTAKYYLLPRVIRSHRKYFSRKSRGFGEDAFHSAWEYIFKRYPLSNCLEIGVYRGQTISLWALLSKIEKRQVSVVGISPLSSAGDSVSNYLEVDYREDILKNFRKFSLTGPKLIQEYSQSFEAKKAIENGGWDLIYIDGSHEFEVCLSDLLSAEKGLKAGGILVVDDSSLYSDFSRSFKGHPGPSKAVSDFLPVTFTKILSVGHNNFYRKDSEVF